MGKASLPGLNQINRRIWKHRRHPSGGFSLIIQIPNYINTVLHCPIMLAENQKKIDELRNDTYFHTKSMNEIGREYVKYLQNAYYGDLSNPEPVNTNKNTLSMALNYIKNIDEFVRKEIHDYTKEDMRSFIESFRTGKIMSRRSIRAGANTKIVLTNKPMSPQNLKRHIHSFKRFIKVYQEYTLGKRDFVNFDWVSKLQSPTIKRIHAKYPEMELNEIIQISESMCKPEYQARVLLSINLMGRKCEMCELTLKDIDFRSGDKIFIQLPDIKKHSYEKVPVELYEYAKNPLKKYLRILKPKQSDRIFPSKDSAFAKELLLKSQEFLGEGKRITPKILRKLGVCVAQELERSREDVENIGGWARNSPVVEHYFSRSSVGITEGIAAKADSLQHRSVYATIDKMSIENKMMKDKLEMMEKIILNSIGAKKVIDLKADMETLRTAYSAKLARKKLN